MDDRCAISGGEHADPVSHCFDRPDRVRPRHPAVAVLWGAVRRRRTRSDLAARHLFADAAVGRPVVGPAQRPDRPAPGADGEHGGLGAGVSMARRRRRAVDAVCGARARRRLRRQHRRRPGLYRRHHQTGGARPRHGHDRRRLWPRVYFRARARRLSRRQQPGDRQSPDPGLGRRRAVVCRPVRRAVCAAREPPARTARPGPAAKPRRPDPRRAAPAGIGAADHDLFPRHPRLCRDGEHLCAVGVAPIGLGAGEGRLCLCLSRPVVGDHAGRADPPPDQALRRGAAVVVRPGAARDRAGGRAVLPRSGAAGRRFRGAGDRARADPAGAEQPDLAPRRRRRAGRSARALRNRSAASRG